MRYFCVQNTEQQSMVSHGTKHDRKRLALARCDNLRSPPPPCQDHAVDSTHTIHNGMVIETAWGIGVGIGGFEWATGVYLCNKTYTLFLRTQNSTQIGR
jgi:hypothetical protein